MNATKFIGLLLFGLLSASAFAADPPMVYCIKPEVRQIIDYHKFSGRLEPVNKAELRARVSGPITKVHVRIGDQVQKDQVLVEIDPRPYEIGLLQADAALIRAEAHLKRCEIDEQRVKQQLSNGKATAEVYDRYAGELEIAKANVLIEKANREVAKMTLEQTKVRAPFAGRVMSLPKSPGNLAKADVTELLQIVATDEYYVTFDLIEDEYREGQEAYRLAAWDVKRGSKRALLEVRLEGEYEDDLKGYFYSARFHAFEPQFQVDEKSGRSIIRGRVVVANRTGAMLPGMSAELRRQVSEQYSICQIDKNALQQNSEKVSVRITDGRNLVEERQVDGGFFSVWIINRQNQLEQRRVETGSNGDPGMIEIRKGLTKDDRVALVAPPDGWSAVKSTGRPAIARKLPRNDGAGIAPSGSYTSSVVVKSKGFGPTELNDKELQAGDRVTPIFVAEELPQPRVAK